MGILPGSVAATSHELAVYYQGSDFARVTVTPAAIRQLSEAVAYAHGTRKHPQIRRLLHSKLAISKQPAQALKRAGKSLVFSDYSDE